MIYILYIFIILILLILLFIVEGFNTAIDNLSNDDYEDNKNKLSSYLLNHEKRTLNTLLILRVIIIVLVSAFSTLIYKTFNIELNVLYGLLTSIFLVLVIYFFPKKTAYNNPLKYINNLSFIIIAFYFLLFIFTSLFLYQNKALSKALNIDDSDDIDKEDIKDTIEDAAEDGTISEEEEEMINNIIEFDEKEVNEIMVPRTKIVGVDLVNHNKEDIKNIYLESGFSRLPVYKGSLDNIVGILYYKDFMNEAIINNKSYRRLLQKPIYVLEHDNVKEVLNLLQTKKVHLAIIKDEYGGTSGLVTLEDILEELVGEIYDEHDKEINLIKEQEDGTYLVDANIELDILNEELELDLDLDELDYTTLNGYLLSLFGYIPTNDEVVKDNNATYKVLSATKTEIKKVLITK